MSTLDDQLDEVKRQRELIEQPGGLDSPINSIRRDSAAPMFYGDDRLPSDPFGFLPKAPKSKKGK